MTTGAGEHNVYPCPCCGYLTFSHPPGSDDICQICQWQDDYGGLLNPTEGSAPNHSSLVEAQESFAYRIKMGALDRRLLDQRMAKDTEWRPFDPTRDKAGAEIEPYDRRFGELARGYYWRRPDRD